MVFKVTPTVLAADCVGTASNGAVSLTQICLDLLRLSDVYTEPA